MCKETLKGPAENEDTGGHLMEFHPSLSGQTLLSILDIQLIAQKGHKSKDLKSKDQALGPCPSTKDRKRHTIPMVS